jgi:glycosyltransferase involved in cell wall biosynthesis
MANYNNGKYIETAVESVLLQSFSQWELIVIDDASSDDSLRRIERFLADRRIRMFVRPRNEGYTKALIFGLKKVRSGLVGILDSDDALVADAVGKVYAFHSRQPELGLVLSQVIMCDSDLKPLYVTRTTKEHMKEPLLWMRGTTAFRSFKMAAYAKTAGLDERMISGEDADLLFKLEEVAPVRRLDEALYRYRQIRSSKSKAARSYNVTYSCIAWAIYRAYQRRCRATTANLPKQVVEAWMLAGIRYCFELDSPLQAARFAIRAIWIGGSVGLGSRTLAYWVQAFKLARRRRSVLQLSAETHMRYLPVREFQSNTGNIEPHRINCIPPIHKPGHCQFGGDYHIVSTGRYRVWFEMVMDCPSFAQESVVNLEVYENFDGRGMLAERRVRRAEVTGGVQHFSIEFDGVEGNRVEFRVYWFGQCSLSLMGVLFQEMNGLGIETARAESDQVRA